MLGKKEKNDRYIRDRVERERKPGALLNGGEEGLITKGIIIGAVHIHIPRAVDCWANDRFLRICTCYIRSSWFMAKHASCICRWPSSGTKSPKANVFRSSWPFGNPSKHSFFLYTCTLCVCVCIHKIDTIRIHITSTTSLSVIIRENKRIKYLIQS